MDLFGDKTPFILMPHPDVRHSRVVDVLSACSACGVKNIAFAGG